jgi:hypothetical protein
MLLSSAFRVTLRRAGMSAVHVCPHFSRHLAAWWLKEAFRRGKLLKPDGSLWHTFRRVWATERKHLPPNDVAAAGGWLDTGTLQQCYQQCDLETLRSVVEFESPQRAKPAWLQVTK